ncbi:hypothetical protein [Anaerocolumna sp. MB42-C2]|uniref:hypothetical protein n=1 Tax=Anaerocolumna sp. MB42-C2 TaxID=3070997 RepID=UPI0027E1F42D|nr:hypothetical protein [Anaerocolumna sp. MB42-C2]WMJ90459.1 hypothetical protein RBU59_13270 [Anaerocolumna sp. MB42-C2]
MIGEPDWPFGTTHCRFDLFDGSKRIAKRPLPIDNDGSNAREDNCSITWNTNNVTIMVSGEEQEDREYVLNFEIL